MNLGECYVPDQRVSKDVPGACLVAWPSTGPGHNVKKKCQISFVTYFGHVTIIYCLLAPVYNKTIAVQVSSLYGY